MAFVVRGLYNLAEDFAHLAMVPDDTYDDMLKAAANVMVDETKTQASTMLVGPYYKGYIADSVKMGRIRKNKTNGRYTDVIFYGNVVDKKHPNGERLAKIAFINEYGKRHQPARPFISMAIDQGSQGAVDAAAEIYYKFIDKYF